MCNVYMESNRIALFWDRTSYRLPLVQLIIIICVSIQMKSRAWWFVSQKPIHSSIEIDSLEAKFYHQLFDLKKCDQEKKSKTKFQGKNRKEMVFSANRFMVFDWWWNRVWQMYMFLSVYVSMCVCVCLICVVLQRWV